MALVQQELHDMKLQLDAGSVHRITANDTQLCQRIEQLKERFRELLMHLRKRRAAEAENAIMLSEEVGSPALLLLLWWWWWWWWWWFFFFFS